MRTLMKYQNKTRRDFLKSTGAVAGGYWLGTSIEDVSARSANEKLNIACIGVGGRGPLTSAAYQAKTSSPCVM